MLITNDRLKEFNEYCYKIQIEYNRLEYTDRTSNFWTHERMDKYRFSIVTGLLRDANSKIIEILRYQYDIEMLYSLVKLYFFRNESKSKKIFEVYGRPELYKPRSFILSISDNIYDWVKSYNYLYIFTTMNTSD